MGFGATGTWSGTVSGNTIGTVAVADSGCDTITCGGISTDTAAISGTHDITITGNTVRRVNGHGIFVANNSGTTTTATVRTRIEGNVIQDPEDGTTGIDGNQGSGVFVATTGAGAILNVKAGGASAAEQNNVTGNWGTQNGGTLRGVRFSRGGNTTFCVSGFSGPFDSTSVGNYITTQNTGNAGSATQSLVDSPRQFTGPTCPTP
jgi:parallel beta-helix repeat protein